MVVKLATGGALTITVCVTVAVQVLLEVKFRVIFLTPGVVYTNDGGLETADVAGVAGGACVAAVAGVAAVASAIATIGRSDVFISSFAPFVPGDAVNNNNSCKGRDSFDNKCW